MVSHPTSSSHTSEWHTPEWLYRLCLQVLGTIDLDPASSKAAWCNNNLERPVRYFDKETNGLLQDWTGTLFINPPGERTGKLVNLFWDKLLRTRQLGNLEHAIFIGFNISLLKTTQSSKLASAMEFPICVPKRRIAFYDEAGICQRSPTKDSVIVYVPGTSDMTNLFVKTFDKVGVCKR